MDMPSSVPLFQLDFYEPLPIQIEVSDAPLTSDAGLLPLRQFDERIGLTRAAQGHIVFVSRQSAAMVEQERQLKRVGKTDVGTLGLTAGQAGGDFRLRGNIASLDARDARSGMVQRYNQITFEMVDLERGVIVWSGIYEFSRAAADDVIYR